MRKAERQMNHEDALKVLASGEYGILSTVGENEQPEGTPLSFVTGENVIYFHCAMEGQKLNNISRNNKVCFTVVGKTNVLQSKFSTEYESVMVFGKAYMIQGSEKEEALKKLILKYSPDFIEEGMAYIQRAKDKTCVFKIEIESLTGKHRV